MSSCYVSVPCDIAEGQCVAEDESGDGQTSMADNGDDDGSSADSGVDGGADGGGDGDGGGDSGGDGDGDEGDGDDGDGDEGDGDSNAPEAPKDLTLSYSHIKHFDFTWTATPGAKHYRLLEREHPDANYVQVSEDVSSTTLSLTVPLHRRLNGSYIVQACNDDGCTDSDPVDVVGSLAEAVGYVKASNTGDDLFGWRLALSDDGRTLAVGAAQEDSSATGIEGDQADNSAPGAGAVYVYTRDQTGIWSQEAYIKASNTEADDSFGKGIALSGDGNTLAVGAPGEDSDATDIDDDQDNNSSIDAGAVYVYAREMGVWTQQAYVKASKSDDGDGFGKSVALSQDGSTLAVGAPEEDSDATGIDDNANNNSAADSGAVYMYARADMGWTPQAYVKASNTDALDHFGDSVALSDDGMMLAVGAPGESSSAPGIDGDPTNNSLADAGAVYVYARDDAGWAQQAYVKASNPGGDFFGTSVSLDEDGTTLAVGALMEASSATKIDGDQNDNSLAQAGAAYVFARDQSSWTQSAYVKASNTGGLDYFGCSVVLSDDGDLLAVGAYREDGGAIGIGGDQADNSLSSAGAVYVYTRGQSGVWTHEAYVKAPNTGAFDFFGIGVALSEDGSTLAVGARGELSSATGVGGDQTDDSITGAGAVYLY
jgi:hypothetical protein